MVEATQIVIGVYALLILAYVSVFVKQRTARRRNKIMQTELDTMASAFNEVHRELSTVNDGIASVLERGDPVHDRLAAHSALDSAERIVSRHNGASISSLCEVITHPARLLANSMEHDGHNTEKSLIASSSLTNRLKELLESCGVRPDDLSLTPSQFERLGSLFEDQKFHRLARDAYEASLRGGHRLPAMSGLLRVMRAIGTRNELIETLESHIIAQPDDIPALIEQLSLLPESDPRSTRNRKRLHSLEWDGDMDVDFSGAIQGLQSRASGSPSIESPPDVIIQRARSKLTQGKLDEVLDIIDLLNIEDRNLDEVLLIRARVAHMQGQGNLAMRLVGEIKFESDEVVLLEASILVSADLPDEALDKLMKKAVSSESSSLYEACIKLSLAIGKLELAKTILEQADSLEKTVGLLEAEVLALMRNINGERDDHGVIPVELMTKMEECSSKMVHLDREDHRSWLASSYFNRISGNIEEARICVTRARRISEESPDVMIEEARILIEEMKFDEARSILRECDKVRADPVEVGLLCGLAFAREGRMDEAKRKFVSVLQLDPNHVSARLNMISIFLIQDNFSEAARHSSLLIQNHPENPAALRRAGEALVGLSMWDEAIEMLERAVSLGNEDITSKTLLASCLLRTKRGEQAENLLNEAIRINPQMGDTWACRAKLYLEFNKTREAALDLEKAWECDPKRYDVLMMLAELDERNGDLRAASRRWRQVLDVNPTDQHARSRLRIIKTIMPSEAERVHVS